MVDTAFRFGWISSAAFIILIGSIAGGLCQVLGPKRLAALLGRTLLSLRGTALTIISLIALASVMNHAGMIGTLAQGIVSVTGHFYPLFAPLIGAVGTFVTGSDTSSNILFAKLQVSVAQNLGIGGQGEFMGMHGSGTGWLLAANTTGATGGKMLSPQSIAIATAACGMKDSDDAILRAVIPYTLACVLLTGLLVLLA